MGALARHLSDSPAASIDEGRWRGLLKRFGVYSPEDTIGFDELLQLYAQTLGTLRDCFAPRDFLRSMRRVTRRGPRLKDRYDNFEFRTKDSLGKVYRCRDALTKEPRSCRQIRKDKASAPIDSIRECLAQLRELAHPRIPAVVEHLEDFHNFYVMTAPAEEGGAELMDLVQDSFVQSRPLTELWVADVLRQVLEAAAYCHAQPLGPTMHRDLRPGSILLSAWPAAADLDGGGYGGGCGGRPHVAVTGFGLQAHFDLHGLGGALQPGFPPPMSSGSPVPLEVIPPCSMPEFVAPEVWQRDFGPRCDVWACGCIMFLLLTGSTPFSPKLPLRELVEAVATAEPDWRLFRHASTSALSLCRRMLAKDDAERPSAAECLRHPWFASPGGPDHIPKGLRPETFSTLVQFHVQAKFRQVLMNVVAAELKVGHLRRVSSTFVRLDTEGSGCLGHDKLQAGLATLGISPETVGQVLQALDAEGSAGGVAYGFFLAGCIDLVDDKLDHMLWKVFAMVDEDHSGEMSAVVLAHFLEAVRGDDDGGGGGIASGGSSGDVERYLRGVLDPGLTSAEIVERVAGGRNVVTFEDVKGFVLEGACAGERRGEAEAPDHGPEPGTPSPVRVRGRDVPVVMYQPPGEQGQTSGKPEP